MEDGGGTKMYCHMCQDYYECRVISLDLLGKSYNQRVEDKDDNELKWFRRARKCLNCDTPFATAEIKEDFLRWLKYSRNSLIEIKRAAEETKRSASVSEHLTSLTNLLDEIDKSKVYW